MAEPTRPPALPSTADTAPYVPVSWTAVAAVIVAGLFALVLLALGLSAFTQKKPLDQPELLVLPVLAVVLSFAARRVIRNSEGTRTGEQLAVGAWWTALVLGLGFAAYLWALDFSVRRDAGNEVERWVGLIREEKTDQAFYVTLPPGGRQGLKGDMPALRTRFRDELVMFGSMDLPKLAQRNNGPGEFTFVPTGVSNWKRSSGTIDCRFAGTVKCPEGNFPIVMDLKGVEGITEGGGRQWMIARPQSGGFVQPSEQSRVERTTYGWLVGILESNGAAFGKGYADRVVALGPLAHPYLFEGFVVEGGNFQEWDRFFQNPWAVIGTAIPRGVTVAATGDEYAQYLAKHMFKLPGGGEPSAEIRNRFLMGWNSQGLLKMKDASASTVEQDSFLKITDTAIEVYVPVDLPLLSAVGKPQETARGRLVVACKDPTLLAELRDLKAAAKTEKPTDTPPMERLRREKQIPWRVVRIESDMHAVVNRNQPMPAGGG